ncbi:MAG TPA: hypothetical protein VIK72_02895 [Clostridiaceae bacterium]
MKQKAAKVYVVFKTHLDIGFTDLVGNVTEKYMDNGFQAHISLFKD